MIKLLTIVKGVALKSTLDDHNQPAHILTLKLEMTEGVDRVQEIVEQMKNIVEVSITSKQPSLLKDK